MIRTLARLVLGGFLVLAGTAHLTWLREEFPAQVPDWVVDALPVSIDAVVVVSGVVEIAAGLAVLLAPRAWRPAVGWAVAALFVAVFPGNVHQWLAGNDAFGLDTDGARLTRLFFQPLLVAWALWCTGAWAALRGRSGTRLSPGAAP
ncbi:hypothetical protein [Nocardioides nanhaiensis]|uniref:Membrane protein n=1 Tax=Nocardioides nanhaiensis TaxID=1476871 RepID=A0ABP8WED9_9ACTN